MIAGMILAGLYLLLASRIITKKLHKSGWQKQFQMVHKIIGFLFLILSGIHFILVIPLLDQRPVVMTVTGVVMVLAAGVEAGSYLFRGKLAKRWIWMHRGSAIIILTCLLTHIGFGIVSLNQYKGRIESIELKDINLNKIEDGSYMGEYDAGYIYARVVVTVSNHRLQDIQIMEHKTEKGKSAEVITEQMIEQQRTNIDAISGATNSSKVIEKAVCNALES